MATHGLLEKFYLGSKMRSSIIFLARNILRRKSYSLLWFLVLVPTGCSWIVKEDPQDFPNDSSLSGIGFYTAGQLDSNRLWHSPDEDLPVLLQNVRTISPCALKDPQWINQGDNGNWLIEWPFDGDLSVNCPLASAYWDTLVYFDAEQPWSQYDQMVLYGYSILPSDTLPPESLLNVTETERKALPLDTILFAYGATTLDSFYMSTDSFRQVIKKVGSEPFGVLKALFETKVETLFYSETRYQCPEESYESCASLGIEFDTLDTRILLDTTGGRTGVDTLRRLISPFCINGLSLCDNAFRIDSVSVEGETRALEMETWNTFFYERTSECNEWNLFRLRHRAWLPSARGQRLKRNADFTLYRERFDRINGDRGCDSGVQKNLWLSLDSLRPVFNEDTLRILDSLWKEKQ